MSITFQTTTATLIEKAANDLIGVAKGTPEDKANWQPTAETRTVINQLVECCLANQVWATILKTRTHEWLPEDTAEHAYATWTSIETVIPHLHESSQLLANTIRSLSNEELSFTIPFPWKMELGRTVAECCFHPYWNMVYHHGQIAYIQTMYGDMREHCDAGPFGESTEWTI